MLAAAHEYAARAGNRAAEARGPSERRRRAGRDGRETARLLALATPDAESALPYYGALLSLPACEGFTPADLTSPREREQALQTLTRTLMARSRARPLLMIIEDIQWIDPTSLELDKRIVSRIASERMLLVATHRSDSAPVPLLRKRRGHAPARKTRRPGIGAPSGKPSWGPTSLPRWMPARSSSEPTACRCSSRRSRRRSRNRSCCRSTRTGRSPAARYPTLLLPASLKDFLTERLDTLGRVKRLAQLGSVFGRQFEFDDLLSLSGVPRKALLDGLSQLETAGVIAAKCDPTERHLLSSTP